MKKIAVIFIILSFPLAILADIISSSEREIIYHTLEKIKQDSSSLNFLKDWASSTMFKVPLITDIIDNPMRFPEFVDDLDGRIGEKSSQRLFEYFGKILYLYEANESLSDKDFVEYLGNSKITSEKIFDFVEFVWEKADRSFHKTWENVSEEERNQLEYFAFSIRQEAQDSLKYKTYYEKKRIVQYDSLNVEDIIPIIEKIDFAEMIECAVIMQTGFEVLQEAASVMEIEHLQRKTRETKFGSFCVGSVRSDNYEEDYAFILDPAGDDNYSASICTNYENPFYWLIDLSGNDKYQQSEIGSLFSVFFGCGINADLSGDDFYFADDFAFSSNFGIQTAFDLTGDDIYKCGLHSLAAATFGISTLSDATGNDIYSVSEFGEGFAGTLAAGLLLDFSGNDLYYAGGKYLHVPLAPLDYRSLSQGFGFGLRPDLGGGIGVLFDENGNDRYIGGVYAQAVAYWYALGILLDKGGNDFYDAVYYPQGSGIHLAGGFLYDENGEDHYYSKHGPGQGAGHDYAVGFLIDKAGDDSYSVEGGNGLGLTNSVGIFYDVCGNDRYERVNSNAYGYANKARDSGGIGIFIDTGGDDSYPKHGLGNDSLWINGYYGVGFDTLLVESENKIEELAEKKAVNIDSLASIEKIFSIASEWEVGSAGQRVKKAREILLKREKEAAEYISQNQMDTKSGLVFRAIKDFAEESTEFKKIFPELFEHPDSLVVKNMIALIGEIADSTFLETMKHFEEKRQFLPSVLSALGKLKTDKSTEILADYIASNSEKLRVITARGLKKIDSEKSRKLLLKMENDSSFLIRTMIDIFKEKENEPHRAGSIKRNFQSE